MGISAEYIKSVVSMQDVLNMYGIECSRSPIPCPLHHGKNKKFYFTDKQFICFSKCQEKGDIFSFVMAYEQCDFKAAYKILVEHFCLKNTAKVRSKAKALEEERLRREAEQQKKNRAFLKALDDFTAADRILNTQRPKHLGEELSIEFAEALKNYDILWERLQKAKWNLD